MRRKFAVLHRDRQAPRGRAGSVIPVLSLLCLVMLMGVSTLAYMTRTDVVTSLNLVDEFRATHLAESIAIQIEARANRRPWDQRFWLLEAQAAGTLVPGTGLVPQITFDQDSGHVNLTREADLTGITFTGIVKDLDGAFKDYRVYVEVGLEGDRHVFSWDKRYKESLLGSVNRDSSRLGKDLNEVPPGGAGTTDQLLDAVRESAEAPPENTLQQEYEDLLSQLRQDHEAVENTQTLPPEPLGPPALPPVPDVNQEPEVFDNPN